MVNCLATYQHCIKGGIIAIEFSYKLQLPLGLVSYAMSLKPARQTRNG